MTFMETLTGQDTPQKDNHAVSPIPARLQKNEKVIIITADNTEDLEFFYPYYRFTEDGYSVDVVTPDGGKFEAKHKIGLADTKAMADVKPEDYALLYIPGGKAPATLRENEAVLDFVKAFAKTGRPIAAICHGPQVLISAGLVKGKQMAAWPEIKKELEAAGATFVDEALVEDGQFITARKPGDLPRHLSGVLEYLKGKTTNQSREQRRAS